MPARSVHLAFVLALGGLLSSCATRPPNARIDPSLAPLAGELPATPGNPHRRVGVVESSDGRRLRFVDNELIVDAGDSGLLRRLESLYSATVLASGEVRPIEGLEVVHEVPRAGRILVRVDPMRSEAADLVESARRLGILGRLSFSSERSQRLIALVAREAGALVSVNPLLDLHQAYSVTSTREHPTSATTFRRTGTWPWMTDAATDPNGLQIGVIRAWNYARYHGHPPRSGVWTPATVAMIDVGFALDPQTGMPMNGNLDFGLPTRPLQANLVDRTNRAGQEYTASTCAPGSACRWHGTVTTSVATARPANEFGTAGTGGDSVRPLLIRIDLTAYMTSEAIRLAVLHGAEVINMSFGGETFTDVIRHFDFSARENVQEAVNLAASYGVIPVASAGNDNQDNAGQWDNYPCTLNHVICVGAMRSSSPAASWPTSGDGARVDIWAPQDIFVTATPITSANSDPAAQIERVEGTSISAPFVAGVVGLMKAISPSLTPAEVLSILQSTANPSSDPRMTVGYVNASRAVMALRANQPPTISVLAPGSGAQVVWGMPVNFVAGVEDPEQGPLGTDDLAVSWVSDRDGTLCTGINCDELGLTFGTHQVTATVQDPFDASATATVVVDAVAAPIALELSAPSNGATFYSSQSIAFAAAASLPNELFPDASYVWTSSEIGSLGFGAATGSRQLPVGAHEISVVVTDSLGRKAEKRVKIGVVEGEGYPSARIVSPVDNYHVEYDQELTLVGEGSDPVDTLGEAAFQWSSDLDGVLGSGRTLVVKLSSGRCGIGTHVITLRVTNSTSKYAEQKIDVLAGSVC